MIPAPWPMTAALVVDNGVMAGFAVYGAPRAVFFDSGMCKAVFAFHAVFPLVGSRPKSSGIIMGMDQKDSFYVVKPVESPQVQFVDKGVAVIVPTLVQTRRRLRIVSQLQFLDKVCMPVVVKRQALWEVSQTQSIAELVDILFGNRDRYAQYKLCSFPLGQGSLHARCHAEWRSFQKVQIACGGSTDAALGQVVGAIPSLCNDRAMSSCRRRQLKVPQLLVIAKMVMG